MERKGRADGCGMESKQLVGLPKDSIASQTTKGDKESGMGNASCGERGPCWNRESAPGLREFATAWGWGTWPCPSCVHLESKKIAAPLNSILTSKKFDFPDEMFEREPKIEKARGAPRTNNDLSKNINGLFAFPKKRKRSPRTIDRAP
jgi:hypothetical protein